MSKKTTTGHGRRPHSAPHGHTTLQDWRLGRTPAPRRRRMSNYAINLAFLETYVRDEKTGGDDPVFTRAWRSLEWISTTSNRLLINNLPKK